MKRLLRANDVVFMYPAGKTADTYQAYGATVLAWGGAHKTETVNLMRSLNIHPTATMWCLTAGAKTLHQDHDLRDNGVCRDITGDAIAVPWLFDHVHEGTPSYFGCTNSPSFRKLIRHQVQTVMAGGADGLHVDDPLGAAQPVPWLAGCFCAYCVDGFRQHLVSQQHSRPELRELTGLRDFASFDYRQFASRFGQTRVTYVQNQETNPLHNEFHDWQLAQSTANLRELGELAQDVLGRPITLSANTCLPELRFLPLTQVCDYLVAENDQFSAQGTEGLDETILAYRMGEALGKPMATTARGQDWALVQAQGRENLVLLWIALAYACGQRFMAPHRQWCYTADKGSDWYNGPVDVYAPIYQFIARHPELFNDLHAVGPLAVPDVPASSYIHSADRHAFHAALTKHDPTPLKAGPLRLFPRESPDGSHAVVHLLNYDYHAGTGIFASASNIPLHIPPGVLAGSYRQCRLHAPGQDPQSLPLRHDASGLHVTLPSAQIWSVAELLQ